MDTFDCGFKNNTNIFYRALDLHSQMIQTFLTEQYILFWNDEVCQCSGGPEQRVYCGGFNGLISLTLPVLRGEWFWCLKLLWSNPMLCKVLSNVCREYHFKILCLPFLIHQTQKNFEFKYNFDNLWTRQFWLFSDCTLLSRFPKLLHVVCVTWSGHPRQGPIILIFAKFV